MTSSRHAYVEHEILFSLSIFKSVNPPSGAADAVIEASFYDEHPACRIKGAP